MADDFDTVILNQMERISNDQLPGPNSAIKNAQNVERLAHLVINLRQRVSILEKHRLGGKKNDKTLHGNKKHKSKTNF